MNQNSIKYTSNLTNEDQMNQSNQQRITKVGEIIEASDPFRVQRVGGKTLMILFNIGLFIGIMCAIIGTILTIIPGTTQEDIVKNQLLNLNSKWKYEDKQNLLQKYNIQLNLLEQDTSSSQMKSNSSKKNNKISNPIVGTSKMILQDAQSNSQIFQEQYSSPIISLENAHFTSFIDLNAEPINVEDSHCLQIKISNAEGKSMKIENSPKCGQSFGALPISFVEKKQLSFTEMIKMGLCENDQSCEQVCDQNEGTAHAIQKKSQGHNSLDKNYEISKQTCTASFAIKELCYVFQLESKQSTANKFIGGCYQGNSAIYDFSQNVSETKVIIREQEDPYLAALNYSQDYSPYIATQTPKEKLAITLYSFGIGLFAVLIAVLVALRIKEERDSKFTKISKVSELTPQNISISQ